MKRLSLMRKALDCTCTSLTRRRFIWLHRDIGRHSKRGVRSDGNGELIGTRYLECYHCGRKGRGMPSDKEAIREWNLGIRTAPPADGSE